MHETNEEYHPQTYSQGHLKVSKVHEIWYVQTGNPDGIPFVVFHGGPGYHSTQSTLSLFDLDRYRVIQFDQRGCGNSLPTGEVEENSTIDTIEDAERIREHLGVDKWFAYGGSWGSTLALYYAQNYPNQTLGLMLKSLVLGRKKDLDWIMSPNGAARLFPDLRDSYDQFLLSKDLNRKTLSYYALDKINNGSLEEKQELAAFFENWETNLMSLQSDFQFKTPQQMTSKDIESLRIFLHYDKNKLFIPEGLLLKGASKLKNHPVSIIHGRYDVLSPVDQAYELHKKLPHSKLEITNFDGHKLSKDSMRLTKYMIDDLVNQVRS